MPAERPDFEQFAREKVAQIPSSLKTELEGWAKLFVAWHTGSDAFGKRITGDARRVLRKTVDSMQVRIAEQHGNGASFGSLFYDNGLDHAEVRSLLAGGLSESERSPRPGRKPKASEQ